MIKQITVRSGKIKPCIQDEHGHWRTPKKRQVVMAQDGTLAKNCSEYIKPDEDEIQVDPPAEEVVEA